MTVRFSSLLALLAFAFSGLGAEPAARLKVGGGEIEVSCDRPVTATLQKSITEWVTTCARAVTSYYGHFPVKKVRIEIAVTDSDEVSGGMTYGYDTPVINLNVGNKTKTSDLAQDWILTHEMVHLSFPSVADEHHWIEEGIATYVEPIARAQIHQLTPESIWADVMENAPAACRSAATKGSITRTHGGEPTGAARFSVLRRISRFENRPEIAKGWRTLFGRSSIRAKASRKRGRCGVHSISAITPPERLCCPICTIAGRPRRSQSTSTNFGANSAFQNAETKSFSMILRRSLRSEKRSQHRALRTSDFRLLTICRGEIDDL